MKNAEIKESIFLPQNLKCGFNLRFTENDSYYHYDKDENGNPLEEPYEEKKIKYASGGRRNFRDCKATNQSCN